MVYKDPVNNKFFFNGSCAGEYNWPSVFVLNRLTQTEQEEYIELLASTSLNFTFIFKSANNGRNSHD